jgi:DNA-directed RNA polymerase subunit RPC12/RpoP
MAKRSVIDEILSDAFAMAEESEPQKPDKEPLPYPAKLKLGTADCPECGREVTVLETRKGRPFINCGYCFVRIFYNGDECIKRLRRRMARASADEEPRKRYGNDSRENGPHHPRNGR